MFFKKRGECSPEEGEEEEKTAAVLCKAEVPTVVRAVGDKCETLSPCPLGTDYLEGWGPHSRTNELLM